MSDKELILFGGREGVDKTTCAAATALYLAKINPDKKILIVSTDPAHPISDRFDCEIGGEITCLHGFDNLFGLEINLKKIREEFKIEHGVDIFTLASRVPYVDRGMVSDLFNLSMPGMDEVAAMLKITDLLKAHEYDQVIMDTAPAGPALRLLELLDTMDRMLDFTERSQKMYRSNVSRFSRRKYVKDEADRFLDRLRADVRILKSRLADNKITEFIPITTPEAVGAYKTDDLIRTLDKYRIPVNNLIIDWINLPTECDSCASGKKDQEKYIEEVRKKFSRFNIIKLPSFPHEIRGTNDLERFAEILFGKTYQYPLNHVASFEEFTKKLVKGIVIKKIILKG